MSSAKQYTLYPYQIIPTQLVSGNVTSAVTDILYKDNICIQIVYTGTLDGTFTVQVSNDYNATTGAGDWDPIPLNPTPTATGSPGSILLDLQTLPGQWIQTVFNYTSGSGNLTATISGKAI